MHIWDGASWASRCSVHIFCLRSSSLDHLSGEFMPYSFDNQCLCAARAPCLQDTLRKGKALGGEWQKALDHPHFDILAESRRRINKNNPWARVVFVHRYSMEK